MAIYVSFTENISHSLPHIFPSLGVFVFWFN